MTQLGWEGLTYERQSPYNRRMAGNTFGERFRVTTAGVSHGPGYLAIIDGCPSGLPLSVDDLLPDLMRRRPGQSKIVTQRDEADLPEIVSGIFEEKTDGTPIGIFFRNNDQRSADYGDIKDKYRPGHADFTFDAKFGFRDYRGGGRSSGAKQFAASLPARSPRKSWPDWGFAFWVMSPKSALSRRRLPIRSR